MSRIYTHIGVGGSETLRRAVELRELIEANDLGKHSAGDIVQCNMGWKSEPGLLYRQPAEIILETSPSHPEAIHTDYAFRGVAYSRPGHRGVVRNAIEKAPNPRAIFLDYEPRREFYPEGTHRFDLAFRRFTEAEMEITARNVAIEKSEMYRHTGKTCKAGIWNTPMLVLDQRVDWGAVRDLYAVAGLDLFIINDYKYATGVQENYEITCRKIEKVRAEMPDHIEIVVALTSSLDGARWEPAPTASLLHKALAARGSRVDALWWTNADWYVPQTKDTYQQHTHALGGVFGGA